MLVFTGAMIQGGWCGWEIPSGGLTDRHQAGRSGAGALLASSVTVHEYAGTVAVTAEMEVVETHADWSAWVSGGSA
jgi:hypothetical protein